MPPTGLKQWTAKLSDDQRDRFAALPTSSNPVPIIAAVEDVLGKLPKSLPAPSLQEVVIPPEVPSVA